MPPESLAAAELRQPVLASKLNPPRLRNILTRPRLIKLAQLDKNRLLTICAGPGYGKTTLMAQLAELHEGPKVWYQVDHFDRDPAVFLRQLITGISNACNGIGKRSLIRLSEATNIGEEAESILAVLIDEMREGLGKPLMICIDDYHIFDVTAVTSYFFNFLIKYQPEKSIIVLASRNYINVQLGRIRTQGLIEEITEADLRFSNKESKDLLCDMWDLIENNINIEKLCENTEGWVAGLVLAESFFKRGSSKFPDLFSQKGLRNNIYEYLAEEVLDQQSLKIQSFLMKCSLMEFIDPEICEEMFHENEFTELVNILDKQNLFICSLSSTQLYRFHPLFRVFLRSRLENKYSSNDVALFKRRLAKVFEKLGAAKEAVELYIEANRFQDAVRLLEEIGEDLLRNCGYVTFECLLGKIEEKRISPLLKIYHGKLLMAYGESERAIHLLRAAKQQLSSDNIEIFSKCSISIAECLSDLGRDIEGISEIEPFLDMTLSPELRSEIIYRICVNYWNNFNDRKVELYCSLARKLADETNSVNIFIKFQALRALQALRSGDFKNGYNFLQEVIKSDAYSLGLRNLYINNLASCLMMLGKYKQASLLAEECLANVLRQKEKIWLSIILDSNGCILCAIGDDDLGSNYLMQAMDAVENMEKRKSAICAVMCHLGTNERRRGNYSKAYDMHVNSYEKAKEYHEHYDMAMCMSNIGADLFRFGKNNDGEHQLFEAEDIACKYRFRYVLTNVDFHRAWAAHLVADNKNEKKYLKAALKRAKKYQHNHFMIQEGKISLPLFTTALSNDIEFDYVSIILEMIGEPALFALEPLLSSPSEELRIKITKLIGRIGGRNAATLLHRALKDEEQKVRSSAKAILANLRHEKKLPSDILTSREMEVLEVLATGASNRQIAELLFISEPTVKTHVNKIFRKLGISKRLEAVLYYQQMK